MSITFVVSIELYLYPESSIYGTEGGDFGLCVEFVCDNFFPERCNNPPQHIRVKVCRSEINGVHLILTQISNEFPLIHYRYITSNYTYNMYHDACKFLNDNFSFNLFEETNVWIDIEEVK